MAFTLKTVTPKSITKSSTDNNIDSYQKITCLLNSFKYKDEESGFCVFTGKIPERYSAITVTINEKRFVDRRFNFVGVSSLAVEAIKEGQEVEVWGNFEASKIPGQIQFSFAYIQEKIPDTPQAIELFLSSGKIHGIGPARAKKIVKHFGIKTIEVLDHNPDLLLEVEGINAKVLEMAVASWREWRSVYEVIATMRSYGVGDSAGLKIFEEFKEKALTIIKTEPYLLTSIDGIGFKTADKIAQAIGISPLDPQRIEQAIYFTLETLAEKGHTAYPKVDVIFQANELLQIPLKNLEQEVENLITKNQLVSTQVLFKNFKSKYSTEFQWVKKEGLAHKKHYNTELRIANELQRIMDFPLLEDEQASRDNIKEYLSGNPNKLDISQLKAAENILFSKVSILTGGPGTGKTHTIKSLLNYFDTIESTPSEVNIDGRSLISVLCAPTGRAAKKMQEATGRTSSTIHSLLGFQDGDYKHNEFNKLEGDVFIVDESSMIDIWLMSAFLKAIPSHARIIFVGDVDQLPSVSAGDVLKNMINSGFIPVSILSAIHRQALNSNIIVAAHKVIHKELPPLFDLNSDSDFVFCETNGADNIQTRIMDIIANLVSQGIPHNDIQILSPKKDGDAGTHRLNDITRGILNPYYLNYADLDTKYIPGDRIMQLKNNKELNIYNGDIGIIKNINAEEASLIAEFGDRIIEFSGKSLSNLILSFAMTVHKSQGSDYPYVIIPLASSHISMWDINLLYTAITRGKLKVILVGEKKVLSSAIASYKQVSRVTCLQDHIADVFNQPKQKKNAFLNY